MNPATSETNTQDVEVAPARGWFRFSIRTALVTTFLVAVLVGNWTRTSRRQQEIGQWIEQQGGHLWYEYEVKGYDQFGSMERRDPEEQPTWKWIPLPAKWKANISKDYEWNIAVVSFHFRNVPSDLSPLSELSGLQLLNLGCAKEVDLKEVAKLKGLKSLDLSYAKAADLSPLEDLQELRQLNLVNADVTEFQVEHLQQRLPNCQIEY